MSSEPVVEAREVSKVYHVYDRPADRLKEFLFRGRRRFHREVRALESVSFSVEKGECFGFVGRNGSGKSTLLQILAGILTPSSGTFAVRGRVAALLELGAGFNPDFSGRDNVYLNAALLGLTEEEVSGRFHEIEKFADIGPFVDDPVKTYSSGMFVRLAFAVAVHVDPELLIVDEALAVGDAAFQYKCMRKIEALRERGTSILFVTHDTAATKRFCARAGWLHEGRLVEVGDAVAVTDRYTDFLFTEQAKSDKADRRVASFAARAPGDTPEIPAVSADGPPVQARILGTSLGAGAQRREGGVVSFGDELTLSLRYRVLWEPPDGLVVGAAVFRNDDLYVCGLNTYLDRFAVPGTVGEHVVRVTFDDLRLLAGGYYFKVGIFDARAHVIWDFDHRTSPFTVVGPYVAEGVAALPHRWSAA